MCEPVTITMATTAAIGTGLSVYSKVQAGKAQQQIAENNAELARQQGDRARLIGTQQAAAIEKQGRRMGASALTQLAASGVDTTVGSPAALLAENDANAAAAAERARANATMQAWGFEAEAEQHEFQGEQARRRSILGATAAGVSGIGSGTASSISAFKQFG